MSLKFPKVVRFHTTPGELRRIADGLERAFAKAKMGDDVPKYVEYGVDDEELHFVIDQEETRREQSLRGKPS